jgi:hypothetical protein
MLHSVRHSFLIDEDRSTPPHERVLQLVKEATRVLETRLRAEGQEKLVPIRTAVGTRTWGDRIRRLQLWADDVERCEPRHGAARSSDSGSFAGSEERDAFSEGPEPWWQVVSLRLRGRPDEARTSGGVLTVTDLKTGNPFVSPGELKPEIEAQLHLYAYMAETIAPEKPVRLVVQHSRKEEIPWDGEARARTRERHRRIIEAYPVGAIVDAAAVATPGSHCVRCRIRPRCTAYLKAAPCWWANGAGNPRPLPYDAWGLVSRFQAERDVTLEIVDPSGRAVLVEGLERDRDWNHVRVGTTIYLFDLEPSEDVYRHGVRIHPRNFHEAAPGAPWTTARGVKVFVADGSGSSS